MLGREIEKRQQSPLILDERCDRLGVLGDEVGL